MNHGAERIEKRCRREELRFVERAAPDFRDLHGERIDWDAQHDFESVRHFYRTYWKATRKDRVRQLLQSVFGTPEDWLDVEACRYLGVNNTAAITKVASASPPWTDKMLLSRGLLWFVHHHLPPGGSRSAIGPCARSGK